MKEMKMEEIEITVDGVLLSISFETETYSLEPYSWGVSRGTETDIYVNSVCVCGVDIMPLLSDEKIEEIEEKVRENLE